MRLANYSPERLIALISNNIACLQHILTYNVHNKLLFFRIGSGVVPFASHALYTHTFDWQTYFKAPLQELGAYIIQHDIRISMHPDQFVVLNSPNPDIVAASIRELEYHAAFLAALGLDTTAKIQIHVGGVYADKPAAIQRFITTYYTLSSTVRERLVIENDDRLFSLQDCLSIFRETGIPIIFDTLHHECLHNGESQEKALLQARATWQPKDGVPMIDYSSQAAGERIGKHAATLDTVHFTHFLTRIQAYSSDIMLEIKDKEKSAGTAVALARSLNLV